MDSSRLLGLSEGCETWVYVRMEPSLVEEKYKMRIPIESEKWKPSSTQRLARAQP